MILVPALLTALGAAVTVPLRARPRLAALVAFVALAGAFVAVWTNEAPAADTFGDLTFRTSGFARLVDLVILVIVAAVTLHVAAVEPLPNWYPVALLVAASAHVALSLTAALPIFLVLVAILALPILVLVHRIREDRSLEAAMRHFGSVAIGGSLGAAALALAAQQPATAGEERLPLTLLLVLIVAAFALLVGTLPFHVHLAGLTSDAPVAGLALLFGAIVPLTFVAFPRLLSASGLLPEFDSVAKAQILLGTLGLASTLGGALLAVGAPDLRRLVAYSVISNVGAGLVGFSTFSNAGIIGAAGVVLVTGLAATQQLVSAGALERAMLPEDREPSARRAPLAASAFLASSLAIVGLPPLAGFAPRFLVEQISFAVTAPLGVAVFVASVALLVAHLRAGLRLFGDGLDERAVERRPVAGALGALLFVALLAGGIAPDRYLGPLADYAREFLFALRPF